MLHCLILSILSTERLISNETNQNDVETTPNTIYEKSLLSCSNNQPYSITCIDSISMYFDKIQNYVELTCQFSTGDIHDLLRFIIFILEKIYINKFQKKTSFLSCEIDQIISCCTLSKTLLSIFKYLYQRHGQCMQTCSTLDTSSNNLFTNIERLGTRDLLSYGQLSYDTI
ncbi:unnamed protein product [Rotaria sp. Silwood1]|nr:unnamed protein product [Rotaria sp. Silwood1]